MRTTRFGWAALLCAASMLAGLGTGARAEEATAERPYSGDFFERSTLTGDWGGARNDLLAKGVKADLSVTQVTQGVMAGGKDGTWQYGGRGNLTLSLDSQKLGLWPGGFLSLEAEGNWTDSVNGSTGAISPANSNQLYPVPTGDNFNIPQLSFTQFLSPYFGVLVGKLDTTSGDANEFAHGKGDTQFFNLAFNLVPVLAVTVPYSPLGAGVIVLPTKDPADAIVSSSVIQATATASTSGFDNLDGDDLTFGGEGRLRTGFFGLTGHQLVGGTYSNKEFTSIDQRLGFGIENRGIEKEDGSWGVFYNFDQYLYEIEPGAGRGVGFFGRFAASDGNPNLLQYFYSAGVGGTGIAESRPHDRFGIGYYYIDVERLTLDGGFRTREFLRDEWGFEVFYNLAVTPWLLVTPDIQVIGPTQKRRLRPLTNREPIDNAVVLGFRLQIVF
jgi:porin